MRPGMAADPSQSAPRAGASDRAGGATVAGLAGGFAYPFRALGYMLRRPGLWRYALLPVLVTATVLVALLAALMTWGDRISGWIWARPEDWYWLLLWYPFHVLVLLLLFALGAVTVPGLVSSPFNKALSKRIEQTETGEKVEGQGLKAFFKGLPGTLADELRKIAFLLGVHLVILLLNLVPVAGHILYPAVAWSWTVLWLAAGYLAFSLSRHRRPFLDTPRTVRKNLMACAGFGSGVFLMLLVPLLNVLFVPVAVIGGTLLYLDLDRAGTLPSSPPKR
jgi:CysZ protein